MKKYPDADGILYICVPLLLYMIVNMLTGTLMETVWLYGPGREIPAMGDAADSYTILGVWSLLCMIIPAGAGCLCVRREAFRSLAGFRRSRNRSTDLSTGGLAVLCVAAVCLSLGINFLVSLLTGSKELSSGLPASLPGPAGFVLSAVVYGIYMPFIEEILFRGILFSRMKEVLTHRRSERAGSAMTEKNEDGDRRTIDPAGNSEAGYGRIAGPAGNSGAGDDRIADPAGNSEAGYGRIAGPAGNSEARGDRIAGPAGNSEGRDAWMAVLFSAAMFGLYHGAVLQGIYAFFMGIVFAQAYGHTGRLSVPWGLHGSCNLCILLLQWTDRYRALCSPAWAAAFFSLAAAGFYTVWQMQKKPGSRSGP